MCSEPTLVVGDDPGTGSEGSSAGTPALGKAAWGAKEIILDQSNGPHLTVETRM